MKIGSQKNRQGDPQEEDEFEDGEDEEPDLFVKEGESVSPLYVVR